MHEKYYFQYNTGSYRTQDLSQDLKTGCLKLAIAKFVINIRHDILIQCHGNYMGMKKFNYMLEIDILRNSSQFWGVS